jgi:hypothetical protein
MDEIKLVDLRKENLNTVKEAIKLASSMGAAGFKLYVNPNFIKTGLVSTRIVPMSAELPPKSQLLLNFAGLKNLKNTIEFAKKVLGDAGEIEVAERPSLAVEATPVLEDLAPVAEQAMDAAEEAVPVVDEEVSVVTSAEDDVSIQAEVESELETEDETLAEEELTETTITSTKPTKKGKKKKSTSQEGE